MSRAMSWCWWGTKKGCVAGRAERGREVSQGLLQCISKAVAYFRI